jgi:hypothetical protein
MSNVFESSETFCTFTERQNKWGYNLSDPGYRKYRKPESRADISVFGSHYRGAEPFSTVEIKFHVDGRSGTENLNLNRDDCIALSQMFAAVAADMEDVNTTD